MIDKVSEALRLRPVVPLLIRNLDPLMASPVARDPYNQRRRTQRVQRNAAIGAESSRANDLDANDLDHERAHVVAVACNARRIDRSREKERAKSSDCDWLALSPLADSVLDLRYRVIQ